ncbi:hypothetical protein CES85_0449 [Ochrobactrum quorumnocens]|uniref:Uncharacterized protein n=1 Tax=Ochrobactrum quorumnocens TaxID=271865 RepID=A0A248ULI6_9HYPH|nr:hypothetical protein CES85_0449 [[Ochrobactrum] quorumnocens]
MSFSRNRFPLSGNMLEKASVTDAFLVDFAHHFVKSKPVRNFRLRPSSLYALISAGA